MDRDLCDILTVICPKGHTNPKIPMNEPINPYASPQADISIVPQEEQGISLDLPGLRTTGIGLSLVYYGIVIMLLALIGCVPAAMFFAGPDQRGPTGLAANAVIVMTIMGIVVVIGGLLNFIGQIVCIRVPSQTGSRKFVIASMFFDFFNLIQFPLQFLLSYIGEFKTFLLVPVISYIGGVLSVVFLILFMRKLSDFLGRRDFMDRARNILILGVVLIGIFGLMFAGMAVFHSDAFSLLGIVALIVGLIAFVMYANLINALRKVLLGKAPRARNSALLSREIG
jgi:hypothetical protein